MSRPAIPPSDHWDDSRRILPAGDPVCQHRAVVRFVMGWLPEPSPAAPAVALVALPRPCLWCNGCGRIPNDVELRLDICRTCGGSGRRPTAVPAGQDRLAA